MRKVDVSKGGDNFLPAGSESIRSGPSIPTAMADSETSAPLPLTLQDALSAVLVNRTLEREDCGRAWGERSDGVGVLGRADRDH